VDRPLPILQPWNRPYFKAGLSGSMALQRCLVCGRLIYYPRPACPYCLSSEYEWTEMQGTGKVYTYAVVWRPQHEFFNDVVPIVLATIELVEGPLVVSSIVNCAPEFVQIGMPVRVVFERVSDDIALPKFEPIKRE
jgi:hypothetical protein